MSVRYCSGLNAILSDDDQDIVLLLNNASGDWTWDNASKLANHFRRSRAMDTCSSSTKDEMLGRYTNPTKENNIKSILLNVHVRKTEVSKDKEITNLKKALSYLNLVLFCKKITVVPSKGTDMEELDNFIRKELKGNDVIIIGSKSSG